MWGDDEDHLSTILIIVVLGIIGLIAFYLLKRGMSAKKVAPAAATGDVDQNGIKKLYPDGPFGMNATLAAGRQDGESNRWNVASDEPEGAIPDPANNVNYEVTLYMKVSATFEGFNLKVWGPHHGSKGTSFEGSSTPCCWYDIGIEEDGTIKTQIEKPHPDNADMPNPGPQTSTDSIANTWVGVKWVIYKIDESTRKVEFWQDKAVSADGTPGNDWQILVDKTDAGDWLPANYSPPDQQEIELRVRNVDPGAIEVKHAYARDITPPTGTAVTPPTTSTASRASIDLEARDKKYRMDIEITKLGNL